MTNALARYGALLDDIKARVQRAQTKAVLLANQQMIELYWDVGRLIHDQQVEGWGTGVLQRLATDLKNELPEVKGFSKRNLRRMSQFYRAYPALDLLRPQAVARLDTAAIRPLSVAQSGDDEKVPQAVAPFDETAVLQAELTALSVQIPWGQNLILIEKIAHLPTRLWYMQQTVSQGWSRSVLAMMIES